MAQVRDENAIRVNFDAVPERPLVPSAANEGFEPEQTVVQAMAGAEIGSTTDCDTCVLFSISNQCCVMGGNVLQYASFFMDCEGKLSSMWQFHGQWFVFGSAG